MTTLPAVVTILDLTVATSLSSSALFEAVQTTNGVAESVGVSVTQIMTTGLGALPTGGATGQLLNKSSGADFVCTWSSLSSFISANATSGITIAGSTTLTVALTSVGGLSVLGVTGTATAIPLPIAAASGGQVLRMNDAGTGVEFGAVNLASAAAVTGVLSVPKGGTNTSTLTAFGVVYGNGTSTVGITAAGTTGWPLVGRGSAAAPVYTSVLPGIGMVAPWNGGYVTGRYYAGIYCGGLTPAAALANLVYFSPMAIGETHTFDRLAIEIATMGSATTMRIALYSFVNGVASSLLVDAGTVTLATGFMSAVISQSLTAGFYFGAVVLNGTCSIVSNQFSQMGFCSVMGFGNSFLSPVAQLNATLTFGAFPVTAFTGGMGTANYSAANIPFIGVRA